MFLPTLIWGLSAVVFVWISGFKATQRTDRRRLLRTYLMHFSPRKFYYRKRKWQSNKVTWWGCAACSCALNSWGTCHLLVDSLFKRKTSVTVEKDSANGEVNILVCVSQAKGFFGELMWSVLIIILVNLQITEAWEEHNRVKDEIIFEAFFFFNSRSE